MLDAEILQILVCPQCRGKLELLEGQGLCCAACAMVYPLVEEIPVLLPGEAIALQEWNAGRRKAQHSRIPARLP